MRARQYYSDLHRARWVRARALSRAERRCTWHGVRHFVPRSSVENAPRLLLVRPAPLLEEERHAGAPTLVSDGRNPLRIHGTSARARLAADDHPVDASKI